MPKLQRIKRSNGSLVYSFNIPLEDIEELGWEKGTELDTEIMITQDEDIKTLLISKKEEQS